MRSGFHPARLSRRELVRQALPLAGAWSLTRSFASCEDSATTVHRDLVRAMEQAELSTLFRGSMADQCRTWQRVFHARLRELLGESTPPPRWTIAEESRKEFEKYKRYELLLQSAGAPSLPVYLLVPKGLRGGQTAPAVLCVHGHGPFGHDATSRARPHTSTGGTTITAVSSPSEVTSPPHRA